MKTVAVDLLRRRLLAASALWIGGSVLIPVARALGGVRAPTPANALGPFYPRHPPAEVDADLAVVEGQRGRAAGTPLSVSGRVLDRHGRAIAGARIEVWQANAYGRYHHPGDGNASGPLDPAFQGYALLHSGGNGSFRFASVMPGPYTGRTPHIHYLIDAAGTRLVTQMFFAGEPRNAEDFLYAALPDAGRVAATAIDVAAPAAGGRAVQWDIVLATG
ncbi:protocatechuate 3,4-dioxygenase beta subunit [Plasticicumulans lactativorans]|uniref:Protocatechuate 3,4-dioxygenase beta subunit n=1 Tax=Plasticicumulans lactativorans TaxID=1133106 RepID=A0A4R2LSK1_9GAMM|nr:intradiol ring-cleavage dioxygenase [Plasticicumulans lactativorans]TCO82738.1 protocatechuate 3,4-dioxygenase beta subunit [Plasticicumulans lactativorans]